MRMRAGSLQLLLSITDSTATMDVPFISSGAMSRAHYTLIRKVESAASPSDVDHLLFTEIENVRVRLSHSALSAVGYSSILGFPYS